MSDERNLSDNEIEAMEQWLQLANKEFCLTDEATDQIKNTLLTLKKEHLERINNTDGADEKSESTEIEEQEVENGKC